MKKCDAATVVGLLQEKQLKREQLHLIGVQCAGAWHGDRLADKCRGCDGKVSSLCDVAVTPEETRETEVQVELDVDGSGEYEVSTGIAFLDHMLESFAKHGLLRWFDYLSTVSGGGYIGSSLSTMLSVASSRALVSPNWVTSFEALRVAEMRSGSSLNSSRVMRS